MRNIARLLLFLCLCLPASAIVLTVNWSDFASVNIKGKLTTVTPDGVQTNGAYTGTLDPRSALSDTNGSVSFTNVFPNSYWIDLNNIVHTRLHITITNGTPIGATLNAKDLITTSTNNGGTNAYSMIASDGRYVQVSNTSPVSLTNTGNAFTGTFTGNGAGLTNIAGAVTLSKALFVDPNGNNSTGTRGRPDKPFLTLTAAKTAAQSGDTIFVYPGNYTENNLLKNGVNWHFYPGANVTYTESNLSGAGLGIFDDRGLGAVASAITGSGNFTYILTGTGSGNELGLFVVTNASSNIRFNAKDVSVNFPNTMSWGSPAAFLIVNCSYVNIDVDRLLDLNQASNLAIAVWWMYGETYFHARQINYFGQWGIWSAESFLTATGFNPNITQPIIPLAAFNLWASWDDNASPNYVQMESINMACWFDFKRVSTAGNAGFEIDCVGGKTYVRGEKVQAVTCISMGLGAVNVADSQAWIDVQKLACTSASWFNLAAGSMTANIGQLEDLGVGNAGGGSAGINCASSLGDFRINCPKLTMKASSTAKAVNFTTAGSKLRLHANIDASNSTQPAVTVAAAGVILDNCTLVTSGAVNCISSSTAKNVVVLGAVMANNAKSSNITIQAGALVVDSNVQ